MNPLKYSNDQMFHESKDTTPPIVDYYNSAILNLKYRIDLGSNFNNVKVTISNIIGKEINSTHYENSQILNLTIDEPAGVYLLLIDAGDKKSMIKLVKE